MIDPGKTVQFWPLTGSGWLELFVSIGTALVVVVGSIIAYGRWLTKMNGLGRRVKDIETGLTEVKAVEDERGRQIVRMLDQHDSLIGQVADAKKRAEQCSEEIEQHVGLIGVKIDELGAQSSKTELTISQRLSVVETKIDMSMGKV